MTIETQPKTLPVGSKAPEFNDILATGNCKVSLKDYQGKFLIMVFYPKDQTPGCTRQLCALRDDTALFESLNTAFIGVNPDGLESHERFAKAQNYQFPILVDEGSAITRAYGALKPEGGIQRTVYIIDPQGTIVFAEQGLPEDEKLVEAIRQHVS